MKRMTTMLVAAILTLAVASAGFAGAPLKGVASKIDGDTIIVKTVDGKEISGKGDTKTIRIGDKVYVHDGNVKKKRTTEQ
ncbi:MAG: hypothetical protein FD164_979 [Nitrospirae bacterium]|nr:MAG: hypothetical protein FD164_979 [Nitrospirota bacterium]